MIAVRNQRIAEFQLHQWDDDEVRFILDQHAELDFYSASSLTQQSTDRHVAPLGHTSFCFDLKNKYKPIEKKNKKKTHRWRNG
jgi:hypothetical protein